MRYSKDGKETTALVAPLVRLSRIACDVEVVSMPFRLLAAAISAGAGSACGTCSRASAMPLVAPRDRRI
jgi:hypothetical protein